MPTPSTPNPTLPGAHDDDDVGEGWRLVGEDEIILARTECSDNHHRWSSVGASIGFTPRRARVTFALSPTLRWRVRTEPKTTMAKSKNTHITDPVLAAQFDYFFGPDDDVK